MELKLNESIVVQVNGNKAEIISEKKRKLTIFLEKNKVIAKYSDVVISIEYDKFDAEKLARKIFVIVKQSHKFSISLIQKVLTILSIDELYNEIVKKLKEAKENGDIELLLKVYDFLSKN